MYYTNTRKTHPQSQLSQTEPFDSQLVRTWIWSGESVGASIIFVALHLTVSSFLVLLGAVAGKAAIKHSSEAALIVVALHNFLELVYRLGQQGQTRGDPLDLLLQLFSVFQGLVNRGHRHGIGVAATITRTTCSAAGRLELAGTLRVQRWRPSSTAATDTVQFHEFIRDFRVSLRGRVRTAATAAATASTALIAPQQRSRLGLQSGALHLSDLIGGDFNIGEDRLDRRYLSG
jgi:hypothetical protein